MKQLLKRLKQMQREAFECESLGDRVVHTSTDYQELVDMLEHAIKEVEGESEASTDWRTRQRLREVVE